MKISLVPRATSIYDTTKFLKMVDVNNSVFANLNYLEPSAIWSSMKPYFINVPELDLEDDKARSNVITKNVENLLIADMRHEAQLDLDTNGFVYVEHNIPGVERILAGERHTGETYAAKVGDFLLGYLQAERVIPLSVSLRRRDPNFPTSPWGNSGYMQPLETAHSGKIQAAADCSRS